MGLWDNLTGWLSEDQHERVHVAIDPGRVDTSFTATPVAADEHYFRISVAQMFLQKKSTAFQEFYPAVHSVVRCTFAGQSVELPNVADPTKLLQQDGKGDWIARNFTLLPLMPFKGGEVRVVAGLYAVKGENRLKEFIGVLGGFAGLLAVPQLSAVLAVAQPLAAGIQALFGGGGGMHLGYQNTFVGKGSSTGNVLQEGYIALIRLQSDSSLAKRLFVINGELHEGASRDALVPFERADFMLLRIEVRTERDDWNELTSIASPRQAALSAIAEGMTAKAAALHKQSLVAALQAPEITGADRRRVIDLLNREYAEAKTLLRARSAPEAKETDFGKQMRSKAISLEKARELGEPTYDEVFATV